MANEPDRDSAFDDDLSEDAESDSMGKVDTTLSHEAVQGADHYGSVLVVNSDLVGHVKLFGQLVVSDYLKRPFI